MSLESFLLKTQYPRKAKRIEDVSRLSLLIISKTSHKRKRCKMSTSLKHDEPSSQNYTYCTPSVLDVLLAKMRLREILEIKLQRQPFVK